MWKSCGLAVWVWMDGLCGNAADKRRFTEDRGGWLARAEELRRATEVGSPARVEELRTNDGGGWAALAEELRTNDGGRRGGRPGRKSCRGATDLGGPC